MVVQLLKCLLVVAQGRALVARSAVADAMVHLKNLGLAEIAKFAGYICMYVLKYK